MQFNSITVYIPFKGVVKLIKSKDCSSNCVLFKTKKNINLHGPNKKA